MRSKKHRKSGGEVSYWLSYSDMMAALLLCFVLIITFTVMRAKKQYEVKEAQLLEQQGQIQNMREKLNHEEDQLNEIIGIRPQLITALHDQFEGSMLNVRVDEKTGSISFDSNILFDHNKHDLKEEGKDFLKNFLPQYFDVILSDDFKQYVAEIIIQGYTDDVGDYMYNLNLSQQRAYSVVEFCLRDNNELGFDENRLQELREKVTANGRSENDLIYDAAGNVDRPASRRVEILFRLREDEMVRRINDILSSDDKS